MPGWAQSTRRRRVMVSAVCSRSGGRFDAHRPLLGGEPTGVGADVGRHGVRLGVAARALVVLDDAAYPFLAVDGIGVVGVLAHVGLRAGLREQLRLLTVEAAVEGLAL